MAVTRAYTGPMPSMATPAVPVSAPITRALSEVVREIPSARISRPGGMVWPTSTWRITLSDGLISPAMPAMVNTCHACSEPLQISAVSTAASSA